MIEPVPFTLPLPGSDTLGLHGARSETWRLQGLLHFDGETVTLEWSTTRHVEQVSLTGVDIDDEASPPELLDVPVGWIAEARLVRQWFTTRLVLRGRRLDAFDGVPGAAPGTLTLRIARRDRALAEAMIEHLKAARALAAGVSPPQLPP